MNPAPDSQDSGGQISLPEPPAPVPSSPFLAPAAPRRPWRLLAVFLALGLAIAAIGFAAYRAQAENLRQQHFDQLKTVGDFKAALIGDWLGERRRNARALVATRFFRDDLSRWLQAGDAGAGERLTASLETIRSNEHYRSIEIQDGRGNPRLSLGAVRRSQDSPGGSRPTLPPSHDEPEFMDLRRGHNGPGFGFRVAVRDDRQEQVLAVIHFVLAPEEKLYPLIEAWPTPSPSAESAIVRREGEQILFLSNLRRQPEAALALQLPLAAPDLVEAAAFNRGEGLFAGLDYRGETVLAHTRPVAGTPWYLISKVDDAEVLGALARQAWYSAAAALAALGLGALVLLRQWRRQQQGARTRLEAGLARIAELSPGVIHSFRLEADGSTSFPYASAAIEDLYGFSRERLARDASPVLARTHPEDSRRIRTTILAAARKGITWRDEHRYQHPAKGEIWLEVQAVAEYAPDGAIVWHGFISDISDRKRAEWRLRRLADVVQAMAKVRDQAGLMAIIRTAARELTGADGATLVLREGDLCHYADEDAIGPLWKGQRFPLSACISGWAMIHGEPVAIEDIYADPRIPHAAYRVTFVKSLSMVPVGREQATAAIGCYWQERHLATAEELGLQQALADAAAVALANLALVAGLEESTRRYRSLFEHMPEAYVLGRVDKPGAESQDFVCLEANPAFAALAGQDNVAGRRGSEMLAGLGESHPEIVASFCRVARSGKAERFETRVEALDRWLAVAVYCPEPDHFAAILEDISLRREAQLALECHKDRLAAEVSARTAELVTINQELKAFTYAASHDLKAPLRGITSFSGLLERRYRERLEGDGLVFLDYIRRGATRMGSLIDDLLAYSQLEQGAACFRPVALPGMVQDILSERQEDIRQARAEVRVDLPAATLNLDPKAFAQVLRNLVDNALKYSAQADPPRIEIGGALAAGSYRLWVRDNGIGFDMAYRERIFDIFHRLHTYEEYPGSGVGLALVKKAMDRMGGRVWAEGAPGEGAVFFLELPA